MIDFSIDNCMEIVYAVATMAKFNSDKNYSALIHVTHSFVNLTMARAMNGVERKLVQNFHESQSINYDNFKCKELNI